MLPARRSDVQMQPPTLSPHAFTPPATELVEVHLLGAQRRRSQSGPGCSGPDLSPGEGEPASLRPLEVA
jgi:hypothetical protein